jgi:hypothetical protein
MASFLIYNHKRNSLIPYRLERETSSGFLVRFWKCHNFVTSTTEQPYSAGLGFMIGVRVTHRNGDAGMAQQFFDGHQISSFPRQP